MKAIQLMMEEHQYIKRMLEVMRKASLGLMEGRETNGEDFRKMIDFVRNYADRHHHGKEEKILFHKMVHEIGGAAEKLVKFGMLVEHDLGRLFIAELEVALQKVEEGDSEAKLDVIANAVSYTHLLHRHIAKEDNVAYPYAERQLKSQTLEEIEQECEAFDQEPETVDTQTKYLNILTELEKKYL